jgi:tetratricopeptide (TPR) repeat protein
MTGRWMRRRVALIVLAMLLAIAAPMQTRAQGTDDLAALREQVRQLHSQGKYSEAIPIAEQYVAMARRKHGENHTEFAPAISWLAFVCKAQGRYAEAEPLYKRALAIAEKAAGPRPPRRRQGPRLASRCQNLITLAC